MTTGGSPSLTDHMARESEMARPERFELPTAWFVARYSIQLSYGRIVCSRSSREGRTSYCPGVLP